MKQLNTQATPTQPEWADRAAFVEGGTGVSEKSEVRVEGLGKVLALPTVDRDRVALIVMPDHLDLKWWVEMCGIADLDAIKLNQGKIDDATGGTGWVRTRLAYPQMERQKGLAYVYIGWRGQVRFRHAAAEVAGLSVGMVQEVRENWAEWGAHLSVGPPYQFVFAEVQLVPQWPLPDLVRRTMQGWDLWSPILGFVSHHAPRDEEPRWDPLRTTGGTGGPRLIVVPGWKIEH